jgi:hypothetical protein
MRTWDDNIIKDLKEVRRDFLTLCCFVPAPYPCVYIHSIATVNEVQDPYHAKIPLTFLHSFPSLISRPLSLMVHLVTAWRSWQSASVQCVGCRPNKAT